MLQCQGAPDSLEEAGNKCFSMLNYVIHNTAFPD